MSEYTEVEQPFLAELKTLGWDVIDQGPDIPSDPTQSHRSSFREWLLQKVFAQSVCERGHYVMF
jgi:type I restriction enzyme, R subunit